VWKFTLPTLREAHGLPETSTLLKIVFNSERRFLSNARHPYSTRDVAYLQSLGRYAPSVGCFVPKSTLPLTNHPEVVGERD
jgi:hypothetical protein